MTAIETKYLAKIAEATPRAARLAFRGHKDSTWKVHSGATRRLLQELRQEPRGEEPNNDERSHTFGRLYLSYHRTVLVDAARNHGFDTSGGPSESDLQLLGKLQHLGAATGLIDFTWDSLVALWFATEIQIRDGKQYAGKVVVVNLNDTTSFQRGVLLKDDQTVSKMFPLVSGPNDRQFYWEPQFPSDASNRVLRQRSVFVIGKATGPELPASSVLAEVEIAAEDKPALRRELETLFGVSEQSLFPDVHGFARANSQESAISRLDEPDYFEYQGSELYQRSEYERAILAYGECIRLDPERWMAHFLRGNANSESRNYRDAKIDYDSALQLIKSAGTSGNPAISALHQFYVFAAAFNRGNTNYILGNYEEACNDYGLALQARNDPRKGVVLYNRANAKAKLEQFDAALDDYDAAIQNNLQYARFNKGNVLVALGRYEEARQCFLDERRIHSFEKADNNIAIMASVLGRIGERQSVVTVYRAEGSIVSGMPEVMIFENESEKKRLESDPTGSRKTQGKGTTFLCTGSAGNVGNFGGEGTEGGSGSAGEKGFCLRVTW